ncbi:hypothetical protein IFM89_033921 [Coptis chinensis]|uniref:Uncharacterized protein n=1 Tax=Coptis chinensis TaxID=261450 RepID=A0A835I1G4_9MAGN|nr:hypothetical protein IFM89_033921 [Coptis chinensis]
MGCGVSRPVINDDHTPPPPAGLSPIRRRIEEIKRSRKSHHKRSKSHLSSKELLDDGVDDDDHHTMDDSPRKSVSYPLESIDEASDHATHVSSPPPPVYHANHLSSHPVYHGIQSKPNQAMQPVTEKGNQVTHFKPPAPPNMDRVIHVTPHSSPQEYCILSADNSVESCEIGKDECKSEGEKREERRRRKDSIVSSEGSVTVLVKKERRGRRFRRVRVSLPGCQVVRGGQVAVKNLLNVKSCYTPPCSNPQTHDKNHDKKSA